MNWVCFTVTTSNEASEAIANHLFEMEAVGVELKNTSNSVISLIAYYPLDDRVNTKVQNLRHFLTKLSSLGIDPHPAKVHLKTIESEEWEEAWKTSYPPQRIGDRFHIVPTWMDTCQNENDILIKIDPGMAFGTGYHPTTRLTLQLMEQTVTKYHTVADLGTGSGILAIAAVKLGAKRVDAIEIDSTAIPVAKTNFNNNDVTQQVYLHQGDGIKGIKGKYDIIVGNILTKTIITIIPNCPTRLQSDGHLIFSGILETEMELILEVLIENGFQCIKVIKEAEDDVVWIGILARFLG